MAWTTVSLFGLLLLTGTVSAAKRPKILGGEKAKIQFVPYQVSLRLANQHFCGGAIISNKHILTAAHCLDDVGKMKYFVTIHSGTSKSNKTGHMHTVLSVHIHPKWVNTIEEGYPNDIAVITLKDPIVFDKYQQKINLPKHEPQNFEKAYVTGWGNVSNVNQTRPSVTLQKLRVELMTRDECKQYIAAKISKKQICAFKSLGTGPCHGDSGGPLVSKGELVGIISFTDGADACATGTPDIYTNVFAYKHFIESAMNK